MEKNKKLKRSWIEEVWGDVRHNSHLIIQDLARYLRRPNKLFSALSENIEDRLEQPLASAYILCLY